MNQKKALNNLKDTRDSLIECNLDYFLIDGTLLGCMREKNFIAHDTDLDLGVFMSQCDIKKTIRLINKMEDKGFTLHRQFGIFGKHFEMAFKRDGIKIDLFFYYKKDKEYRFNAFLNGGKNLEKDLITFSYPIKFFEKLEKIEFLGEKFLAPNNPEEVLKIKYGNWKEIKTNWNWAFSPLNKIK
jgi:phosphorylcholine metabolism protein LicD